MISFIIATSNDGFCGDPMLRLNNTLLTILTHQLNCEIVIVDWGDTGVAATQLDGPYTSIKKPGQVTLRFIRVPTREHFHETRALNIGVRRASHNWIGRLDQDTLVGPKFAQWWRAFNLKPDHFYFSLRRELTEGEHAIRGNVPLGNDELRDTKWFFYGATGILLAPWGLWHYVCGYKEELRWRNHMEHDLVFRMWQSQPLVNLGPLTQYDFYHQGHKRMHVIKDNKYIAPDDLLKQIQTSTHTNPTWGDRDISYEEVVL